jgi:hypothetical protein
MTQKPFTPAEIAAAESAALQDSLNQLARLREILEPLRAMLLVATPGPWEVRGSGGIRMDGTRGSYAIESGPYQVCRSPMSGKDVEHRDDFALIAAARNAIAEMLRVTGGEPWHRS